MSLSLEKARVFSSRLRSLRIARELTQRELVHAAHMTIKTLSDWERWKPDAGIHMPNPQAGNLLTLARILNTSVDYLLGETDDPRPAAERDAPLSRRERQLLALAHERNLEDAKQRIEDILRDFSNSATS